MNGRDAQMWHLSFGVFLWALWLNPDWQAGMGNYGLGDKYLFSVFYHPSFAQHLFVLRFISCRTWALWGSWIWMTTTSPWSRHCLHLWRSWKSKTISWVDSHRTASKVHIVCVCVRTQSCVKIITGVTSEVLFPNRFDESPEARAGRKCSSQSQCVPSSF